MNRWYWGAVICTGLFALTWLLPPYMTQEGGVVWRSEIGRGWNNKDADGNPTHDDKGNRIQPNPVRPVALIVLGLGAAALAGAGYLVPRRRRQPST
jgi:hypothetical protein